MHEGAPLISGLKARCWDGILKKNLLNIAFTCLQLLLSHEKEKQKNSHFIFKHLVQWILHCINEPKTFIYLAGKGQVFLFFYKCSPHSGHKLQGYCVGPRFSSL